MSEYKPDRWALVKIAGDDPHYRVFGSWFGGYLDGDSWRMNSGVVRYEEDEYYYDFFGSSGSCYQCYKEAYGSHSYGYGVMKSYEDKLGDKFQILTEEEALEVIKANDWIIK